MNPCFVALLILSSVVSTALAQEEGCCTPEKWEALVGELGAIAMGGRPPHGKYDRRPHPHPPPHPKVFGKEIAMAYNAESEKIAMITPSREGMMKHIALFKKEKAFIVLDESCKYFNMTRPFQKLCTGDGEKVGSAVVGGSLSVDTYRYRMRGMEGHASVTTDSCIPVGETWFGKMRREYFFMTVGFLNVTEGIKDPDMFKHPEGCEPGRGDIDTYLEGLGVSPIARYLAVNKFIGEPPKATQQIQRGFNSKNDV